MPEYSTPFLPPICLSIITPPRWRIPEHISIPSAKCDSITLYQFMSCEDAEKVFTNWDLKATLPHRTNDPFELMFSDAEPPESRENICCGSLHETPDDACFLCFSEINTSAALWGHYGDSHQGVCLQFSFPLTYISMEGTKIHHACLNTQTFFMGMLCKVHYCQNRFNSQNRKKEDYTFHVSDKLKFPLPFYGLASTKDASWAFEREYRIITNIGSASRRHEDMVFYNVPMNYLSSIDLGMRCKHDIHYVQRWLQHTLKKNNPDILLNDTPEKDKVTIRHMVPSGTTFAVEPEKEEASIYIRHGKNYSIPSQNNHPSA